MRIAGLVGGLGPESTIDYYRSIVALYRKRSPDGLSPGLLIDSIDLRTVVGFVAGARLEELADYVGGAVRRLALGGAQFAAITSNTPHVAFDAIARRAGIPMISIVLTAAQAAASRGCSRAALLGTRFTMAGHFYAEAFGRVGVMAVAPTGKEQALIHDIYMGELVEGVVRPESRTRMLEIVDAMRKRDRIDAVVLAGTELPLLLRGHEPADLAFLDTTQLHVQRIVETLLS